MGFGPLYQKSVRVCACLKRIPSTTLLLNGMYILSNMYILNNAHYYSLHVKL
jgi:hypothetical protein